MWWQYIIIAAVILFGIYGFLTLTSFETRVLSRQTTRRAADLYPTTPTPCASSAGTPKSTAGNGQTTTVAILASPKTLSHASRARPRLLNNVPAGQRQGGWAEPA